MKDRQGLIRILMHPHLDLDEVAAVLVRRDLQDPALVGDAVVATYRTRFLEAQNLLQIDPHQRYESATALWRLDRERGIEPRPEVDLEPGVGLGHVGDAGQGQLLGQAALQGPEEPLTAAAALRAIRRNHLDTEVAHGPTELGEHLLVHRPARLRGKPVM